MATKIAVSGSSFFSCSADDPFTFYAEGHCASYFQNTWTDEELHAGVPEGMEAIFTSNANKVLRAPVVSINYDNYNDNIVLGTPTVNTGVGVENSGTLCLFIPEVTVPGMPVAHNYAAYLAEVASKIQDDAAKLATADRQAALAAAVTKYGTDIGYSHKKRIAGNDTQLYSLATILTTDWHPGLTQITAIEYPIGETPATMLDPFEDFELYDDGTAQDGSNVKLRFLDDTPKASEYFLIQYTLPMLLPSAQNELPNFTDNDRHFQNITSLAAAYCCERLAAKFAQSSDGTITADVVNYHDKSARYQALAKQYFERYNLSVFGTTDASGGPQAAVVEKEIDAPTMEGGPYLFHRGTK